VVKGKRGYLTPSRLSRAQARFWAVTLIALLLGIAILPARSSAAPDRGEDTRDRNRLERIIGRGVVPQGLGVNVHFDKGHEDDLDLIRRLGFRLIRTDLLWSKVEVARGRYEWARYDALVANSSARGIVPLMILAYSNPHYAPTLSGNVELPHTAWAAPLDDAAQLAFVHFAAAAARRYRGQVIWEIWNEPNLNFGRPVDLGAYLRLARGVCRAIRIADPEAPIIGPAASGFPWRFLKDFLEGDQARCFDGISVHPYRDEAPESVLGDWSRLRSMMARAGVSPAVLPVDSEWGYSVIGGLWTAERQAAYVARLYLLDLLMGIPMTIIYDLRDDGPDPSDKEANFGLLNYGGKAKPVAEQLAALVKSLDGLTLIGRVRSAPLDFILAFGTRQVPEKLVAWTLVWHERRLSLGPRLCLSRAAEVEAECNPNDQIAEIDPVTVPLTGQPIVIPVNERGERAP
jgi:polysaccharide biosynthesis protein PslG